jgi:NADPH-dependent ferric siderophore reductase
MRFHRVRVTRVERISPHVVRVALAGESIGRLPFAGPDQRVKLILPAPGQSRPLIDGLETLSDVLALPDHLRPVLRTYTVRHHRPAAAEVDIDFVEHSGPGAPGPAGRWVAGAQPGDEVTLFGPAADYEPPEDTQWQLIAGDETALPAIAAIVESLRHYDRARVFVELADERDTPALDSRAEVAITWLHRGTTPAQDSSLLLDAIRGEAIPAVPRYFWIAGEASIATTIRRHLVNERGVDRDDIQFTGYWRHGKTENEA